MNALIVLGHPARVYDGCVPTCSLTVLVSATWTYRCEPGLDHGRVSQITRIPRMLCSL
jgi:hypothetical protein